MIILVPAYGRKPRTHDDLKQDWESGKDWRIADGVHAGRYTSIRDIDLLQEYGRIMLINFDHSKFLLA